MLCDTDIMMMVMMMIPFICCFHYLAGGGEAGFTTDYYVGFLGWRGVYVVGICYTVPFSVKPASRDLHCEQEAFIVVVVVQTVFF